MCTCAGKGNAEEKDILPRGEVSKCSRSYVLYKSAAYVRKRVMISWRINETVRKEI